MAFGYAFSFFHDKHNDNNVFVLKKYNQENNYNN